ncbi:unnamed protein product [Ilex paraguariensis]|uniref:Uncharacterized protein n=1 Tax=Ilex paraguariensis TaxID=185542 RepID=A0ABC8S690_9AQUA
MSLTALMFRSLVRFLSSFVDEPAVSIATILHYSDLLPQNTILETLVEDALLHPENYLFHFVINLLKCFW